MKIFNPSFGIWNLEFEIWNFVAYLPEKLQRSKEADNHNSLENASAQPLKKLQGPSKAIKS